MVITINHHTTKRHNYVTFLIMEFYNYFLKQVFEDKKIRTELVGPGRRLVLVVTLKDSKFQLRCPIFFNTAICHFWQKI